MASHDTPAHADHDILARELPVIGMVGGGQLARMTHQAAIALGIPLKVLAATPTDATALVSPSVELGEPGSAADLQRFVQRCDIVTFDHELVDLDALLALETDGAVARPPSSALAFATDKAHQRRRFAEAGLPLPDHEVVTDAATARRVAHDLGWPAVVKTARGGYDGRGVWMPGTEAELDALLDTLAEPDGTLPVLVLERRVPLERELAVVVVRTPDGITASYPVTETVQHAGICRETIAPAQVDDDVATRATEIAVTAAEVVGAVGVMAVELFFDGTSVTINEVATRPHNSGHWTIEGAVTSQFENHLRAVAGLPLGDTSLRAPVVVSANVLGHGDGRDPRHHLHRALAVTGAAVHLYGKSPRPGRKLGHVTVLADSLDDARTRARSTVAHLGDPVPGGLR